MQFAMFVFALVFAAAAQAADPGQIAMGRGIAERRCGGCHAVGDGASRLEDAPPFREIYKRYRKGGLAVLLAEGMLTPDPSLEEESLPGHPGMPMVAMGIDERAALHAYMESLEPWRASPADPQGK